MPDEPNKEKPKLPDFSKPAPSMWDTFTKSRVTEFQDPATQVKKEMEGTGNYSNELPNLAEIGVRLGESFFKFFQESRPEDKTEVRFDGEHRIVLIYGEGGNIDIDNSDKLPPDWFPDRVVIESGSTGGLNDRNRRLHDKSFLGKVFPEYFKTESGVCRIQNLYKYHIEAERWTKHERFIPGIYAPSFFEERIFDPETLPEIPSKKIHSLLEAHSANGQKEWETPLNVNDFEQLQTLFYELKSGEVVRHQDSTSESTS